MIVRVRYVGWKIVRAALGVAAKHGGVLGSWQEAMASQIVDEHISALRIQLAADACTRRMAHLSPKQRARAIADLVGTYPECEHAVFHELMLLNRHPFASRVVPTIVAMLMLFFTACASPAPDATCAFSTTAQYTMTVVGSDSAQVGTLACLTDQDAGDDCAKIVPVCDGETLTIVSPRFPDDRYTYTVVSTDESGIVAHFTDVRAGSGYDVHLVEVSK